MANRLLERIIELGTVATAHSIRETNHKET
jgi:hypothetical protein